MLSEEEIAEPQLKKKKWREENSDRKKSRNGNVSINYEIFPL